MTGPSAFHFSIDCRVAIARVIRRRRVIRVLAGTSWLVRRLVRTVPSDALEAAFTLGGPRALMVMIDACFGSARRHPKCGGLPLGIDYVLRYPVMTARQGTEQQGASDAHYDAATQAMRDLE